MTRRVLITRAAEDAPPLAHALHRMGLHPVQVPLLERVWDLAAVQALAAEVPAPDVVMVTSAVTADILATARPDAWPHAHWAAVGPSTRARLEGLGLPCHVAPSKATAHDLVHALGDLMGRTVVYPRADLASPSTRHALEAAGATVHEAVAYRNRQPDGAGEALLACLPVDATPLLSGSAARRIAQLVPPARRSALGAIVAIGPSTAAVAREVGLHVAAEAQPHTLAGILQALMTALHP